LDVRRTAPGDADVLTSASASDWIAGHRRVWVRKAGRRAVLPLRMVRRRSFAALPWLLSGRFQPVGMLPAPLLGAVDALDRILWVLPGLTATRCYLVLEQGGDGERS
jgi:hypothetical protein